MRAKYLSKTEFLVLTNGKVYEVLSVERDWYRIVDDSGEDYLYPPELFELVNVLRGEDGGGNRTVGMSILPQSRRRRRVL